ncbi:probable serine/threonine-protein kinase PBL28 [Vitis vinifera]|uniref:probable serine/threonine-protein kinase PBL28 n=1 Tax=Vitis vinifera TaxID=29760 RepID=UPI00288348F2|nr:probable serine/threonine-protein kinase PBL28 [Vitis vinifera]
MNANRHRNKLALSFILTFFVLVVWCQAPEPVAPLAGLGNPVALIISYKEEASAPCACKSCSEAILDARKQLLNGYVTDKTDTEKGICGLAVLISVAAGRNDSQSLDIGGMFRCFPVLNMLATDSIAKALLAIFVASASLMLIIMLIKFVAKDKQSAKAKEITKITETTWSGLYRFSKSEIEKAISSANERSSLGQGSAGQVFKGVLPSGQAVAIKHIYKTNSHDSFTREVEGLSRIRHPNLVCLFGTCVEDGDMYLVYEFCSAGNLAYNLQKKHEVLTWERRVKILRDCALALRYLHNYIDGCIVHRDIKLTNILLTDNLEPKLSDFGLAKMLGMEESKVFTDVRGTIGYMDPEYMTNAKLTAASDIYSFGIVTLQLLSGQKVIDLDLDARDQLTRKAKDVNMGKRPLKDFEDPRLKGEVVTEDFQSILQVAVLCAAKSNKGRPSIDQVFQEMDRAWKNTVAYMRTKETITQATTSYSRSMEEFVSV